MAIWSEQPEPTIQSILACSLHSHVINGSEQYSQLQYILPSRVKDSHQILHLFPKGRRYEVQQFYFYLRRNVSE